MKKQLLSLGAGALVIALLAALLYLPFLHNVILFDDHVVFAKKALADFVQTPFSFRPRTFPYFTLAEIQLAFGGVEANRIVNLILHVLCAWMLFVLLEALLRQALQSPAQAPAYSATQSSEQSPAQLPMQARIVAFIGALWFVLNPVAVYGAGYLAQRTILFATLFSLLSLWYYRRAFAENRTADIVVAALFFSAAVFSKEHAIMLPAAVVMLTTLYVADLRSSAKRIGLYLLLCIPAAVIALYAARNTVGSVYEPAFDAISGQIRGIPLFEQPRGPWMVSSLLQAGFFFDYFSYWIVPTVQSMSLDMRIDFTRLWNSSLLFPKAILFIASPVAGLYLLRRRGLAALFGCGLLYCWLLYLTELVSVRIQEPFVLYRSYLWAPGYIMMLVALGCALPRRWIVGGAIPILALFFALSHDRLASLRSEYSAWNDAALKLESETVPGADRIYYNRGLRYLKAKKFNEAYDDFSRAAALRPAAHYFYHRGVVHYWLNEFVKAEDDFNRAFALNKKDGAIQFARGLAFERRGCVGRARLAYSTSATLGFPTAKVRIDLIDKNAGKAEKKSLAEPASCTS
ncbi:hypothetical protein D3870_10635 [Noviherbaspirillum cavernae]|uniref:Tetratricopeptide repeat protein n=1 Tax=Noviherbaspirillum cavernae TaxID=2320862 RepID=A0A418X1U0_9BURK|nr:hypothetical protein [Noviherbaspirillum cavernae]RJG06408.1 hypothetical protein D3870_10635 [Noviherbaspirillum cavernae]